MDSDGIETGTVFGFQHLGRADGGGFGGHGGNVAGRTGRAVQRVLRQGCAASEAPRHQ